VVGKRSLLDGVELDYLDYYRQLRAGIEDMLTEEDFAPILEHLEHDLKQTLKGNVSWGPFEKIETGVHHSKPGWRSPPQKVKNHDLEMPPLVTPLLKVVTRRIVLCYTLHCKRKGLLGRDGRGYVQGMDGVAATLARIVPEDQAFFMLAALYEDTLTLTPNPVTL